MIDSKGKYACEKSKYPPDLPPESECKKFLEKAEKLVPDNKKEAFKDVAMIKISDGETSFDCFKREKWENKHGWCETVTSREKSKRWGFCSPSCQYFHADNKPKVISS